MTFVYHYDILGYSDTVYIHVSYHVHMYTYSVYMTIVFTILKPVSGKSREKETVKHQHQC